MVEGALVLIVRGRVACILVGLYHSGCGAQNAICLCMHVSQLPLVLGMTLGQLGGYGWSPG